MGTDSKVSHTFNRLGSNRTSEEIRPTVVLDVYTGRLITIVGPMN
ncbi:hypothetical protein [Sporosarcina cascadiensis]|nr:hypothetical protein [Sporosarcina cascadiensis]